MRQLDIEKPTALIDWLREARHIGSDETPSVEALAGGVSNRTVLVTRENGQAWVVKQALPKLRVAVDWFSDPARNHREAEGIRAFSRLAPPGSVPELVFEEPALHILAMEAVPRPHENFKTRLLDGRVDDTLIRQFAHLLATVHSRAAECAAELAAQFGDRTYFESLRLEPYYAYSAAQVAAAQVAAAQGAAAARFLTALIDATRRRRMTLVHGDYSPKNILVRDGRLVLLDYEVTHFGDGAFDVGFAMAHLISKAHHLPAYRERFVRAAHEFWAVYQASVSAVIAGNDMARFAAAHTLGCLLARAVGRSPLEYLSAAERKNQAAAVASLMPSPPENLPDLIDRFMERIAECA